MAETDAEWKRGALLFPGKTKVGPGQDFGPDLNFVLVVLLPSWLLNFLLVHLELKVAQSEVSPEKCRGQVEATDSGVPCKLQCDWLIQLCCSQTDEATQKLQARSICPADKQIKCR